MMNSNFHPYQSCQPTPRTNYVYFIVELDSLKMEYMRVKIGHTTRELQRRIRELQTGNSRELAILAWSEIKDCKKLEHYLHQYLREYMIQPKSEWFYMTRKLLGTIDDDLKLGMQWQE